MSSSQFEEKLGGFRADFDALRQEVGKVVVGQEDVIEGALTALVAGGHVLVEGLPGMGKTVLARTVADVVDLTFQRIQCTADLMPADVIGTHIISEEESGRRVFRFEKGPVFHHLLLVDEINRATPKTQAALLEAMQERGVTAGGERFELPAPFFVMATQNPIEMEGTYPLPEAQLDRFFFKIHVPFPDADDLMEISRRTTGFKGTEVDVVMRGEEIIELQELLTRVPVAEPLLKYIAELVLATHPDTGKPGSSVGRFVSYGASPRAVQAIVRASRAYCLLAGRTAVAVEDIHQVAKPALRHRVILNFEGEAEQVDVDALIDEILEAVPTPAKGAA